MKQAYCSECKAYVPLDESGSCPGGHPRPCYRDVRDIDSQPGGAPAVTGPPQASLQAQTATNAAAVRWVVIAAVAVVVLIGVTTAGALTLRAVLAQVQPKKPVSTTQSTAASVPAERTPAGTPPAPVQPNPDGTYPPAIDRTAKYAQPTQSQKLWALSTCGILTASNSERHDLLGGCDKTSANIQTAKQVLSQGWGIASRDDLLDTLTWIEEGGHRQEFDAVTYVLAVGDDKTISTLNAQAETDPAVANKLDIAGQYGARLGTKSIAGWDYARYVFLCRRGYLVGYLTEEEAWKKIMPAANVMQTSFDSWKDLGDNYLIGRRYWSAEQTTQSGATMRDAEKNLLNDTNSPWVKLPWDLELGS